MKKILIANRGEIALRIIRTARKMDIGTVLVYAPEDAGANYLEAADQAILLNGQTLTETYLNIPAIINAAIQSGADAIHPGYGFLSENKLFVEACNAAGIIFIGPQASAMEAMGNKIAARKHAIETGVPVTRGITGSLQDLQNNYRSLGFPILIKAAAGGGGKGMRVVENEKDLPLALEATAREARNYFGDDTVYMEKYIENPRHIEVQILGDQHGHVVHLFERECSLQRRHQKIIEEAPSPTLTQTLRERIGAAAVQLGKAIQYTSAGTIEFLVGSDLEFYFLEMNTRIQVEHPVTELTTGIDIVEQQIRIARGEKLTIQQSQLCQNGHAIECRIYAEDPGNHFMPAPGTLQFYKEPKGAHIRIDGMQLKSHDSISAEFDPMISKLIVWGANREEARIRMISALQHYYIYGIKNNIEFLQQLLTHKRFIQNEISTKFIDHHLDELMEEAQTSRAKINKMIILAGGLAFSLSSKKQEPSSIWETIGFWRLVPILTLELEGKQFEVLITHQSPEEIGFDYMGQSFQCSWKQEQEHPFNLFFNNQKITFDIIEVHPGHYKIRYQGLDFTLTRDDIGRIYENPITTNPGSGSNSGNITSPMPGKIIKLAVKSSDIVRKGDLLFIVEAMKMENNITSPFDGTVSTLVIKEGDKVDTTTILATLEPLKNN